MYVRGLGQTCSSALSPGNCASAGGSYDSDGETCNCGVVAGPVPAPAPSTNCAAGASSACSFFDDIWASQACLNWYAQCDPTNPFYVTNTKGLIVGGAQVLGQTAADATASATGVPLWAWAVGAGALLIYVLPALVKK
jgi:hypothetical protein